MRVREPVIPIGPSIAYVPLTKGQYALIDSIYARKAGLYNWRAMWSPGTRSYYAGAMLRGKTVYLHAFLLGKRPEGLHCDHKNRITLDDRMCNLHWVTQSENLRNRSPESRAKWHLRS